MRFLAALAAAFAAAGNAKLACLNDQGDAVAWYAIFKLHGGLRYAYVDAKTTNAPFVLEETLTLDQPTSALGRTLSQLIDTRGTTLRVQWNDEIPTESSSDVNGTSGRALATTYGHTKGVIGGDADTGFWLTQSTPKFPVLNTAYAWPASTTYGQSFLCVSVSASELDAVSANLQYNDLQMYDSSLPSGLVNQYPNTVALVAGQRKSGSTVGTVSAVDGTQFKQFAKSGDWGKDLYEDLVQPALGVNMQVETWRRSPVMDTYCKPAYTYDSININYLQVLDSDGSTMLSYKYTQDHSKWAIAINVTSTGHWACIGDINRMSSQWARGGGTVCVRNAALWKGMSAMVTQADACSEYQHQKDPEGSRRAEGEGEDALAQQPTSASTDLAAPELKKGLRG